MCSPPSLKQQKYGLLKQQKHGLLHQHILYNLLSGIQAMCSGCEALVISHERICACVYDVYDMACCTLHCHDDLFFCIVCYSTASSFTRDTSSILSQQRQMDNCKIFLRMYLWHVRVREAAAEQAAAQFGSMYIKMQQDEQVYRLLLA